MTYWRDDDGMAEYKVLCGTDRTGREFNIVTLCEEHAQDWARREPVFVKLRDVDSFRDGEICEECDREADRERYSL